VRALVVVNPIASATSERTRDVLTHALASDLKIDTVTTERRGHAVELARAAAAEGLDLVVALGGDGTVNEVVNGLLADTDAYPHTGPDAGPHTGGVPDLAVVPGGSTNVFARALGLPNDAVEATGVLLEAIAQGRRRTIGLGRADERYFTFCAGLGMDAEVVEIIERHRALGRRPTAGRYVRTAVRHFFTGTDRRNPALTLSEADGEQRTKLFLAIVTNTTPWTYLGKHPVRPCPDASFETGLDLFAPDRLRTVTTLRHVRQMLLGRRPPRGRHLVTRHDQVEFVLSATRPMALQIDGDYVGERERVKFSSAPYRLRVIA
jgi:diacylglycerol kinase family enzyme